MAKKASKVTKTKVKTTQTEIVEPKGVAMVPTNSAQIASDIDMKLSKQDIIDMMLEEAKEKLLLERDEKHALYTELQIKWDLLSRGDSKLLKPYHEKLKAAIEKKFSKEIAMVALHGKVVTAIGRNHHTNCLTLTPAKGLVSVKEEINNEDEDSYTSYSNGRNSRNSNGYAYPIVLPATLEVVNETKRGTSAVSMTLSLALDVSELKEIYKDLNPLAVELDAAYQAYNTASKNYASLDGSAKKAKAQLVRNILESSSDGQSVLAGLGGMKQALIAQITKK